MKEAQRSARRRRGRIALSVFFVVLAALCYLLTRGLAPYLQRARRNTTGAMALRPCLEISAADRIWIETPGGVQEVRLAGIESPALAEGPELERQVRIRGANPRRILADGRVALHTLTAWISHRPVGLVFLDPDAKGIRRAYAELYGVDIARNLLRGGQVWSSDEEHPRRADYRRCESEARRKKIGVWR
jgi:endonuclease YncB( thermonuclease family)